MDEKKEIKISRRLGFVLASITIVGALFSMANFWFNAKSAALSNRIDKVDAKQEVLKKELEGHETGNSGQMKIITDQLNEIKNSITGTGRSTINTRLSKIEGKLGL